MLTRTQGYFTGTYNAIAGKVTHNGKHVGDVSGKWNESMEYKNSKVSRHGCVRARAMLTCFGCQTGDTQELFNAKTAKIVQKTVRPEEEQEEFESRR